MQYHDYYKKDPEDRCIRDGESLIFIVCWLVMCYLIICFSFALLITWNDIAFQTVQTRKTLLELIRQVNLHEQEGLDILENATESVKEVINRR